MDAGARADGPDPVPEAAERSPAGERAPAAAPGTAAPGRARGDRAGARGGRGPRLRPRSAGSTRGPRDGGARDAAGARQPGGRARARGTGERAVARANEAPAGGASPAGGRRPGRQGADRAGRRGGRRAAPAQAGPALAQLRATATAAAEAALGGSGWAPLVRPQVVEQLEATFARYAGLDAAGLEQALREGAPGATAASALLEPVAEQVKEAVEEGLPDDAPPSAEDVAGGVVGAVKGLLFKKRAGASAATGRPARRPPPPGRGQPLSGPIAARMGEALGDGFSDVQVHTDVGAGRMAGGSTRAPSPSAPTSRSPRASSGRARWRGTR